MAEVKKVLIIDDDADLRRSLADALRSQGIDVDLAFSPEEAIKLISQNTYRVITTDIYHHDSPISGDDFIIENKDRLQKSAVIVFTGNQLNKIKHLSELQQNNVPLLSKADDVEQLIELIQQKLKEPAADSEESDVPTGFELIHTIDESTGWIGQISWSPEGKRLAAQTSLEGVLL